MALLETIRQQTDSPWAKLMFGAVVMVFVFWGIGASGGPKTQAIAVVNGERITDTQLQRIMRNATRGSASSMNEDELNQLTRDVIGQLIQTEILLQEASRLGIEVSDEEIARYVLQIDAFKTESGKFSKELYERNLKRMGLSRGKFEEQIRDQRMIEKLEQLVRDSVTISDTELERIYVQSATELIVDFVRVTDAVLLQHVTVDQMSIDAYVAASETELKAMYDDDYDRLYHQPPRATYSQIRLRTDLEGFEADAVRTKLKSILAEARADGTAEGFAALARRYSEDFSASSGGAMGTQTDKQIPEAARAAILSATPGSITGIAEVPQGLAVYHIEAVLPEETRAFDAVKADIARDILAGQEVAQFSAKVSDNIHSAWQGTGSVPDAMLQEYDLTVQTAGPFSKGQPALPGAGTSPELISALSSAASAGVLSGTYATDGGRIIASIAAYTDADMTSFESQKEMIRMQLGYQKEEAVLAAWNQDLLGKARVVQHYNP
jgi:peptidyl-prolyl cis-trans isomerase D